MKNMKNTGSAWRWAVSYETASIACGFADTFAEADLAAHREHDARVMAGLNPDKLAYHVEPNPVASRD